MEVEPRACFTLSTFEINVNLGVSHRPGWMSKWGTKAHGTQSAHFTPLLRSPCPTTPHHTTPFPSCSSRAGGRGWATSVHLVLITGERAVCRLKSQRRQKQILQSRALLKTDNGDLLWESHTLNTANNSLQ